MRGPGCPYPFRSTLNSTKAGFPTLPASSVVWIEIVCFIERTSHSPPAAKGWDLLIP